MTDTISGTTQLNPLLICHGAEGELSHTCTLMPFADNPWANQKFSFRDILFEGGGTQPFPITVAPGFGELQEMPLIEGAKFRIHCPKEGTDHNFRLRLQSEFTAPLYEISMTVGHYRRKILVELAPPGVVTKGDEITAEIAVESFYIPGKLLESIEVEWWVGGEKVATEPTSDSGKSKFTHIVDTVGELTIAAKVHNPFDDKVIAQEFKLSVISESPWEGARWFINGNESYEFVPARLPLGQTNKVKLIAPQLKGGQIRLNGEEAAALKIQANPDFNALVTLDADGAAEWEFTQADPVRGHLTLSAEYPGVGLLLELRCWVMSDKLAEEADVEVDGVPVTSDFIWFFRDQPRIITLVPKRGSPIGDYPVGLTRQPGGDVEPDNVVTEPAGTVLTHRWTVTGFNQSGTFGLNLGFWAASSIQLTFCKLLSTDLADEADALIDGEVFPEGFIFKAGEKKSLSLRVKNNSPLATVPLKLSYLVVEGDDVQLVSEPDFGVAQTDFQWDVMGATGNGMFKLGVEADGMNSVLYMPVCRIMSDFEEERVIMLFDGKPVRHGGWVVAPHGIAHTVIVKHNILRPERVWIETSDVTAIPGDKVLQEVDPVEGATWQVTGRYSHWSSAAVFFYHEATDSKREMVGFFQMRYRPD